MSYGYNGNAYQPQQQGMGVGRRNNAAVNPQSMGGGRHQNAAVNPQWMGGGRHHNAAVNPQWMGGGYQNNVAANPQWMGGGYQNNVAANPQQEVVRGKVMSYNNSGDVFRGNEILEVSVVDASLMDAPSTVLGRQRIQLQYGQRFPIRFQFHYDKSRAGRGYGGLSMQARITSTNGQLMYVNDTRTPLKNNVKIDVQRI